ncbi:MAG: extracellular solute-binding protein [Bacilli bacterium]|nr:extracellular solute-binding protein [Bacilli bacterium]
MKKLMILFPAALAVTLLAGCAQDKGDGFTHVKFWHTMGQANQEMLDRMISSFEEANPDIKIEAYSQGGYDDIAKKLGDAIPAGTTPTMSFCYPDNVASYIKSGAVENMASYVTNAEYGIDTSDYVKEYWDEGTNYEEEGLYSVPYAKSTEVIFYNATVFKEKDYKVPTTWDEMWALCAQIQKDYSNVKYPLGYDSDSNLFITMCEQQGIAYTTKEGADQASHFTFNNDQAKAMVTTLKEKYEAKLLITKGSLPNNTYTSTMFTNGELMMSIGSTGGTTYNKSLNFDIGVAPIPGSANRHVISQGPSICFFKRAKAAEKVAAWKFYQHITNAENSAKFAMATGYEPVRNSSYNTPEFKGYMDEGTKTDEGYVCSANGGNLLAVAANCTKESYAGQYFSSDVFNGSDVARDAVGGIVANVLLGTKDIDTAFKDALTSCLFTA